MTPLERMCDSVDALTTSRTHREPYARLVGATWVHENWQTKPPSLLVQLEEAVEPSGSTVAGHRVPSSTPAARMDAINALLVIDTEVSQQVQLYVGTERETIADNLRALVAFAVEAGEPDQRALARSTRRWEAMAAIVTGWEVPPRRLHNTCPLCGVLGSLLVRLDVTTSSGTALCTECHETWDETTIGLLASHLLAENGEGGEQAASRPHRPQVRADNELMTWVATCPVCGWSSHARLKNAALRAAEDHRDDEWGAA